MVKNSDLALFGGNRVRTKPFPTWPCYEEEVLANVALKLVSKPLFRGIEYPKIWSGLSPANQNEEFEKKFAETVGCNYAITVNSGTSALNLAIGALGLSAGDEVLVTPYTYIASASELKIKNLIPVFVDIDSVTLNMDVAKAESAITPRTRGMVLVHFGGMPVDIKRYLQLAKRHNLRIIQDCCHTVLARYDNRPLAYYGDIACYSFQNGKLLTCGEGGCVTTNNEDYAKYVFSMHNGGRVICNQSNYTFGLLGNNFRMSELQAALLNTVFEKIHLQNALRKKNVALLKELISDIRGIQMVDRTESYVERDYYMVVLLYGENNKMSRDRFVRAITLEGIPCSKGYPQGLYDYHCLYENSTESKSRAHDFPITERVSRSAVWLDHRLFLTEEEDIYDIATAIRKVMNYVINS